MKKTLLFIISILTCSTSYAISISKEKVEETLKRLDSEIEKRETYLTQQQNTIDSLKSLLSTDSTKNLSLLMDIGNEYVAFDNDSALFYYEKGYNLAKSLNIDSVAISFKLKRATYLPLAGFIDYANDEFNSIDTTQLSPTLLTQYYETGKQLYSYISSYFGNYPSTSFKWHTLSLNYQAKLIDRLDHSSLTYKLNIGEQYLDLGEHSKAKATLEETLNSLNESSNEYARTAHALARIASIEKNDNEYIYYLALSTIADIKSATLEVVSMQELGAKLLELNDITRAHVYSSIALANAVRCKATMRMIQSSKAMPVIDQAHAIETQNWQRVKSFINIAIIFLVLILIGMLIYLIFKNKHLSTVQNNLVIANNIKEVYISQFLNLCSTYMSNLLQFSDIVNRKISSGKVEDLYKITKSGKFIEEQSKDFYDIFDNAFLNIYPTFIENVNALLLPDKQIELKENEKLNTDLRILAFMKLGIEDSSRIAQMLNYSVNTIYAYRNKLKNRAIDRENFEENVMKIKSIS